MISRCCPAWGNSSLGPAALFGANSVPFAIASLPLTKGKPNELLALNEFSSLVIGVASHGKVDGQKPAESRLPALLPALGRVVISPLTRFTSYLHE